jgi:uncharacterized membrane protein YdjX (TVP38/TMEM64 family)
MAVADSPSKPTTARRSSASRRKTVADDDKANKSPAKKLQKNTEKKIDSTKKVTERKSTPSKSKPSMKGDNNDSDDGVAENITPKRSKTAKIDQKSQNKTSNSPIRSQSAKTPSKLTRNLLLNTTPRRYPMLNKDIEVSDRYVDKDGQLDFSKLANLKHNKTNEHRSADTNIHYIAPVRGSDAAKIVGFGKHGSDGDFTEKNGSGSFFWRVLLLLTLLCASIGTIYTLYKAMPQIDIADKAHVKLPGTIEEAKALSLVVDKYKELYPAYVFALFAATYIFLQAFAIPGAVFLSILAGPIWGVFKGIFIISIVATTGSSICFLISKTIARPIFEYYFPQKISQFRAKLDQNRENLFFYLIFLRVAPIFPNWLISVSSPIINVPYIHFAVATFIGIMPNNYIMTTIGKSLQTMTNSSRIMTPEAILSLCAVAFVAILPILLKQLFTKK